MPYKANIEHNYKCPSDVIAIPRANTCFMWRKNKYGVEAEKESIYDELGNIEDFLVEYAAIKVRFLVQELVVDICGTVTQARTVFSPAATCTIITRP